MLRYNETILHPILYEPTTDLTLKNKDGVGFIYRTTVKLLENVFPAVNFTRQTPGTLPAVTATNCQIH